MQKDNQTVSRNGLLFSLIVLGLAAVFIAVPNMFRSEAGNTGKGLSQKTESHEAGLENYDIRADKTAFEKIAGFREVRQKTLRRLPTSDKVLLTAKTL